VIFFQNVRLLEFDPPRASEPTDLLVGDDGRIAAVGPDLAARLATASDSLASLVAGRPIERGGSGGFLSPGLVVGHAHLYSVLSRGMRVAIEPAIDFAQMLDHLWWRLDRAMDGGIIRASGLAGAAEAALLGVTTIIDHHASPGAIDGSLSVLGDAIGEVGLRSVLCFETTDRNGREGALAGIAENERYAAECALAPRIAGGRQKRAAMIGAHAPFTLEDDTLSRLGDLVKHSGRPFHIHVAEDRYDASESRARRGLDPIFRLDRAGCLVPRSIIGHGLYLTEAELDLMGERGCFLAHNARSNMNNGVGYARLLDRVADHFILGTDGLGADMLEELRFAYFKHRDAGGPLGPETFLRALGRNGRLAEELLEPRTDDSAAPEPAVHAPREALGCGSPFQVGAPADLVHWDYREPTPLGEDNLAGHMVFGMSTRNVRSTVVGGRFVVKNREPQFDAERIAALAREEAARLWKRMEERKQ